MNIDPQALVDFLQQAGLVGAMVGLLVALYTEALVFGKGHRREVARLEAEAKFWKELALSQQEQTGRALGVVERISS
jgi:hypothetical protein